MPAQQRCRRHHEPVPAPVREQSSQRRHERPIGGSKPWSLLLTGQNRELVPQQHQFHVLGELGLPAPDEQPQDGSEGKVGEGACLDLPVSWQKSEGNVARTNACHEDEK